MDNQTNSTGCAPREYVRDAQAKREYADTMRAGNVGQGKLNGLRVPTPTEKLIRALKDGNHEFVTKSDFGTAIKAMREGFQLARRGWNGRGMYVALQYPTPDSKMTLPYVYMSTVDGALVPWLASQADILSEDWEIVG